MPKELSNVIASRNFDEGAEALGLAPADNGDGASHGEAVATLRLLWDRRRFLFRLTLAGFVLSAITAFLIPKEYQSTARLMPPDQMESGSEMLAAMAGSKLGTSLGSAASSLLGLGSTSELFVGILQSRTIAADVSERFDLKRVYGERLAEDAEKELQSNTDISEDRKSGIISISVTDRSPERAAAMTQEYIDGLNRLVTEVNTSAAHREREFLEGRLTQVKLDLETAEKDFGKFASENTAIDIQEQGKAMIGAAASLEGQMIAAQTELESLRQVYTDNNVRVRAAQARVDELRVQLDKLGGQGGADRGGNGQDGQSIYPSIRKLPLLGVSYADLYRNMKVQEAIYEALTQEYEFAKVEEAKETPSVKVIDPPDVPQRKTYPHRLLLMLLGITLSFLFGTTWLLGQHRWQRIDPKDPGKLLLIEIADTVKSRWPIGMSNGNGASGSSNGYRLWTRWKKKEEPDDAKGEGDERDAL
jgi:uncharacterized protein involved in exopolysaccharide biosynthesis